MLKTLLVIAICISFVVSSDEFNFESLRDGDGKSFPSKGD
jgi:hypothetical protein